MEFNWKKPFYFILSASLFFACDNEGEEAPTLQVPDTYTTTNYETNAQTELSVRNQLGELVSTMQAGRSGAVLSEDELIADYTTGSPSVQAITTPYYNTQVLGWLAEMAKASGGSFDPQTAPNGEGGVYGSYLFDETGLELEQMVEKGLFGAALYNHALTVVKSGDLTTEDIDKLVAIYGAHPSFQNSDKAAQNKDIFAAKYAARRDKNDGNGLYTAIRDNLIAAKATIEAGSEYNEQRDAALSDFLFNWEKSNMATVINYLISTRTKLSQTNPSEADISSALHAYGEAVGFLHGWKNIPAGDKVISDAQIDQLLVLMNAPAGGASTSYLFVTDSFNELPKLQEAINTLQDIYNFSDEEVADFAFNWVNEQGR